MCESPGMPFNRCNPQVLRREQRWQEEVTVRLPALLGELLESPVFGLASDRELPPKAYGVYLLSDRGRPCYVGAGWPHRPLAPCGESILELPDAPERACGSSP